MRWYLFVLLSVVSASWATHYAFGSGRIYLQLSNNELVALNFSTTGYSSLSSAALETTNIKTGDEVVPLASPPQNSSLFVHNSTLYAVTGASDTKLSKYDPCGDGVFQLLQYDDAQDSWFHPSAEMTFSGVQDVSFYQDSTYLVSPSSSTVYIFGGRCAATDEISHRLLALDLDTMEFSNITTASQPQGFYGGASVWAPKPQQSFVVGGRSEQGWLNMYQLATWDFSAGWSFQEILKNGTTVSSRTDALALPIFKVLSDNSAATFNREYNPTEVLVVGGTTAGSDDSAWAKLSYSDNAWVWTALDTKIDPDSFVGAAVIFNTLVVVQTSAQKRDLAGLFKRTFSSLWDNSKSDLSSDLVARDSAYTVRLFNTKNGFSEVADVKSNTAKIKTEDSKPSINTTAVIVGTVVPLCAIVAVIAGFYLYRRSQKETPQESEALEYQFGHFRTASEQPYSLLGSRPLDLYQHQNDTGSTLDVASMDSWVRKRQEYDARRAPLRDSYLASTETLNTHPTIDDEDVSEQERTPVSRESQRESHPREMRDLRDQRPSTDSETREPEQRTPVHIPRLAELKSFSYTHTPPQSPLLKKRSRLDPGFVDLGTDGADDSCDEQMDVQVLVSSKRKSVLRVVNPDVECRSRTPSG